MDGHSQVNGPLQSLWPAGVVVGEEKVAGLEQPGQKKKSKITREAKATGGGPKSPDVLTPDEEKVLEILSKEAVEGIEGGIDMAGGDGLSSAEEEQQREVTAGATAPTAASLPSSFDIPAPPSSTGSEQSRAGRGQHRQPRRAGRSRRWSAARAMLAPPVREEPCRCGVALLESEAQKMEVLRGIQAHLAQIVALKTTELDQTEAHRAELLALKRKKLELQERMMLLKEAEFIQGGHLRQAQGRLNVA